MSLLFEVVADFKFQAGAAILESKKLQSALEGVSGAAQGALDSVAGLGASVAGQLGLGYLSFFGIATKAVSIQQHFNEEMIHFAGIITQNKEVFAGNFFDNFGNRVKYSRQLLGELATEAKRIGAPEGAFIKTFGTLAFPGLQSGLQIQEIKDMAKNVQMGAPGMGLDPGLAASQVVGLALQGIPGSPQMYKTLMADTKAFKQFQGKGGEGKFGKMDFQGRVKVLNEAFKEFSNRADMVELHVGSLTGQMNILKDAILGVNGLLRPFGETLMPAVISVLKTVNRFISEQLVSAFGSLNNILKRFMDTPVEMFKDLTQMANIAKDVKDVAFVLRKVFGGILLLSFALGLLAKTSAVNIGLIGALIVQLNALFATLAAGIYSVLKSQMIIGSTFFGLAVPAATLGKVGTFLVGVVRGMGNLMVVAFALFIIFQTLTRAVTTFRTNLAAFWAANTARITKLMDGISKVMEILWSPFQGFIEFFGDLLGTSAIVEFFIETLIGLGEVIEFVLTIMARGVVVFKGFAAALGALVGSLVGAVMLLAKGNFSGAKDMMTGIPTAMGEAFMGEIDKSGLFGTSLGESPISPPRVEHHGDIVINNDIKEAFQPDRIAFTITDQIQKALVRPTTSKAGGFTSGFSSGAVLGASK